MSVASLPISKMYLPISNSLIFIYCSGYSITSPDSTDLAIILSLLSSYEDVPLPQGICFAGEVGLNGEIRAVNRIQQRIAEAEKLGFEKIYISEFNKKGIEQKKYGIQIIAIERVDEAYRLFF
jgi:DNA repair protein RadA/Sms